MTLFHLFQVILGKKRFNLFVTGRSLVKRLEQGRRKTTSNICKKFVIFAIRFIKSCLLYKNHCFESVKK